MWIVRLALNRPYTFVVMSLLIVILSGVAIVQTPVDIFPDINIPVVGVIMNYSGLAPQDMQDRLATVLERNLTTTVNDIEHLEAQSYHGISVIKVFFQPGTDAFAGMAQISASSQSAVRNPADNDTTHPGPGGRMAGFPDLFIERGPGWNT